MKSLIFALCAMAVVVSAASADVPDPSNCLTNIDTVQRVLMVPGNPDEAAASFTVTVRNAANVAINNAVVQVEIGGIADSKTALCGGAVVSANTNVSGVASFNIHGGGCYKGANAVVIRANGVEIRNFGAVMSPDYTGTDNAGIANRWSRSITAADFSAFGQCWQGGVGPASCHDYNNDGGMNASDFSVFGQCWDGGTRTCTP